MSDNKKTENNGKESIQVKINAFFDRLRDDKPFTAKVSMAAVAVLLVLVIFIAAFSKKGEDAQAVQAEAEETTKAGIDEDAEDAEDAEDSEQEAESDDDADVTDAGEESGTENENQEAAGPNTQVNTLIDTYFVATASGDTETIQSIKGVISEEEALQIQKKSNYIESFENIDVLLKDGPVENSYVAFVYYGIKFKDIETLAPGLTTLYICNNDEGQLQIYDGELEESVTEFIKEVASASDVVEVFDRVDVKYNEATDADPDLKSFMDSLPSTLEQEVAQALSEANADETEENAQEETPAEETVAKTEQVTATDTVNVRSSDSENADKLGKVEAGTTLTRYEAKENGWSRIDYDGKEAYIKSEFLKVSGETETAEAGETDQAQEPSQSDSQDVETVAGKVVVLDTVNVRKSASETAERIGVAYKGEYYDLVLEQADGWTKIKFNGETGFVKSEFVKK